MNSLIQKIDEKSTKMYVILGTTVSGLLSNQAFADSFDDYRNQNGGNTTLLSGDGTGAIETSIKGGINLIKWLGLLVGICVALGGLWSVKKAAATEGQRSTTPGWIAVIIGGLMTIVATIAIIIGATAENLAGVKK